MEISVENNINKGLDLSISKEKNAFQKIIGDVLDKTSDYIIKSLPVSDSVKDVLQDIKGAIKTNDMKKVVETAVNSSLREGMEFLGVSQEKIEDFLAMKEVLFKGGIRENLSASLDTVYSKYIKGNILSEEVSKMVELLKENINGKGFNEKIDKKLVSLVEKREVIDKLCEQWYKYYEKLDISNINKINLSINDAKINTILTSKQQKDINIINNMTNFVNSKKNYLSPVEMNFCSNV